jgi:transcriptional regulator with XRE-family HTH domain
MSTVIGELAEFCGGDKILGMITPAQSRAARGLIGWSQSELAEASGVSLSTIRDFETGRRTPFGNNMAAIVRSLERAGVEFIPENGSGAGVRLKKTAVH